ncbi:MAG: hypothetical protein FJZ57_05370, partial [Chlamydiae bacterium]|nr:hypothetical protein [Chlamydiota bacterium]
MKGTLFSKFLGVTSICCFSAATLCAVDELRQQSLEMLVVDQNGSGIFPKVFKAAAAVKNSPDPISKILYAPGEISLLGGPVELKAKNSISSITITPASGVPIFKAKLVGISPEMIQNEKIASMANPAIQVT